MVLIKLRLEEQIEVIRKVPFCSLTHTELPLCLQVEQFTKSCLLSFHSNILFLWSVQQVHKRMVFSECHNMGEICGSSSLSVKQETRRLLPVPIIMCHLEEKTTPVTKFCNSRKLVSHLYFKTIWLEIHLKRENKKGEEGRKLSTHILKSGYKEGN